MPEVWTAIERFVDAVSSSGELEEARARQATAWLWSEIGDTLLDRFRADPAVRAALGDTEAEVAAGRLTPTVAAGRLLDLFAGR